MDFDAESEVEFLLQTYNFGIDIFITREVVERVRVLPAHVQTHHGIVKDLKDGIKLIRYNEVAGRGYVDTTSLYNSFPANLSPNVYHYETVNGANVTSRVCIIEDCSILPGLELAVNGVINEANMLLFSQQVAIESQKHHEVVMKRVRNKVKQLTL